MRYLWSALVMSAAVVAPPPTLTAQATSTVERNVETIATFSDFNACNNEPITVSGVVTTTIRTTVDANGVTHVAKTDLGKLDGLGATGAKYVIRVAEHSADSFGADEGYPHHKNYTFIIHYVGQGQAPDFISRFTMHFLVYADNTTKIDFEHVDERCLGKT